MSFTAREDGKRQVPSLRAMDLVLESRQAILDLSKELEEERALRIELEEIVAETKQQLLEAQQSSSAFGESEPPAALDHENQQKMIQQITLLADCNEELQQALEDTKKLLARSVAEGDELRSHMESLTKKIQQDEKALLAQQKRSDLVGQLVIEAKVEQERLKSEISAKEDQAQKASERMKLLYGELQQLRKAHRKLQKFEDDKPYAKVAKTVEMGVGSLFNALQSLSERVAQKLNIWEQKCETIRGQRDELKMVFIEHLQIVVDLRAQRNSNVQDLKDMKDGLDKARVELIEVKSRNKGLSEKLAMSLEGLKDAHEKLKTYEGFVETEEKTQRELRNSKQLMLDRQKQYRERISRLQNDIVKYSKKSFANQRKYEDSVKEQRRSSAESMRHKQAYQEAHAAFKNMGREMNQRVQFLQRRMQAYKQRHRLLELRLQKSRRKRAFNREARQFISRVKHEIIKKIQAVRKRVEHYERRIQEKNLKLNPRKHHLRQTQGGMGWHRNTIKRLDLVIDKVERRLAEIVHQ